MNFQITEKSREAFIAAAKQLNRTDAMPDFSTIDPGMGLYLTAVYMLATIIESRKNGEVNDITNHKKKKYEALFYAENGYDPCGSSGGGFSYDGYLDVGGCSCVGARLSSNSREDCKFIAEEYPDLWQIYILNIN